LEAELEAELEARRRQYAHYRDLLVRVDRDGSDIAWATLPEVAKNLDSQRRPVTKSAREPGPYPYYGASGVVDHVNGYIFDGDYLLVSEDGANLLARSSPIAFSSSGKVWVNNHAHVLQFPSYAERRYVEIYLNSIDLAPWVAGGAQPKLNQANLNRIPIPRPSLPEQQRIVAILDRFDALVNDLSVGLPAELVARRRQYEYYRDRLLSFEEAA
ncbi:MAG: restriction endonuclease subunit S, partial [Acidimicrobiales bacterium]|nr:restriction endonuclease subunit S [Acidimicrobiales bacterium]